MLENDEIKILSISDASQLELEKNIARQKFLELPAPMAQSLNRSIAQSLLDEQINPHQWQPNFSKGFNLNSWNLTEDRSNDDE